MTHATSRNGPMAAIIGLRRDRVAVATLVVWALACLPYALPVSREWLSDYQEFGLFPALLAMVAVASFAGLRQLESPQERKFWTLFGWGFIVWLVSYAPYYLLSGDRRDLALELADDLFYVAFYLCLLLALDLRPHLATASPIADRERWLKSLGTSLLAFASLGYFVLVPAAANPRVYATWVPSYSLYLALDAFLLIRLAAATGHASADRWRLLYGALTASTLLMMAVDALDLLGHAGVAKVEDGTLLDLLWTVPIVAYAWSARLRARVRGDAGTVPFLEAFESSPLRTGSFLLLCAIALPAAHFVLDLGSLLDPLTRALREWVAFASLLSLGGLAAVAYRTLERERVALKQRQQHLEARLRRAERDQMMGRLSESLSNDFGNLLQVIGGRVDPLLARIGPDSPLREDLLAIRDSSRRLGKLLSQIVELVRAESEPARLARLSDVARDVEPLLRAASGHQVTVALHTRAQRDVVRVGVKQVERALLALVANAREAMDGQGSLVIETFDLDVTSRLEAQLGIVAGPYAALSLTDNGGGMSEETRARAFEPFFTTRAEGEHAGLGLTGALHIVNHYGGTIQLESAPGRGTTVTVYLPRADGRVLDIAAGSVEATLRQSALRVAGSSQGR